MKILVVCSTLDLKYKLGCTPSWWQLLKAMHEVGNEVIVVPYLGDPIETPWWRTYPNPCSDESKLYSWCVSHKPKGLPIPDTTSNPSPLVSVLIDRHVKRKWQNHLLAILAREKDVDAVFMMSIPINHISGIPTKIREQFGIPVAYFDGDMPTILPKYATDRGFKFNYYVHADLSEFDAFFSNSKGVIPDLEEMGARNVHPLYYAADPGLFTPIPVPKDIDVSFYGHGSEFREEWMTKLIAHPSEKLPELKYSVGGKGFGIPLGKADLAGPLSYSEFRKYCCRSKVCLNITRWSHTNVFASATARPFELAAYGACIVSQPYNGIEEWFDVGRELIVVKDEREALEVTSGLVSSEDERLKIGERAREKVLREHTYHNRADLVTSVLSRPNILADSGRPSHHQSAGWSLSDPIL